MDKKLDIQWFIEQNADWERLLAEKPYCVAVSRDEAFGRRLMMLKYSQIDSDFHVRLVRECRGLILDEGTGEVVCHPFDKFGNYGEPYCPELDWKSCFVSEKLDGSLIKAVKLPDGNVLVSTNGTIDAFKAPLVEQIGCSAKNFGELFVQALAADGMDFDGFREKLEPGFTYMFELTSPFNKVVVQWKETRAYFIGCRDNATGEEKFFGDHPLSKAFRTPEIFKLGSVEECVAAADKLDCAHEGYVACDKGFNRVKIKSPLYVALHHLKGEGGVMSYRRALEIVKKNEVDEVLTYFPEYKDAFDDIRNRFEAKAKELEGVWAAFEEAAPGLPTRKDKAIWITSRTKTPGLMFAMLDGKIPSVREGLMAMPNESVLKMLGFKDVK